MYSFDVSHNFWCCKSSSSKAILIFPKIFLNFRSDIVESKGFIKLSYCNKRNVTVVLCDSKVTLLWKRRVQAFVYFSTMFCLYTAFHNWRSLLSDFLDFSTWGGILSSPADFLILISFNTASNFSSTVQVWCLFGYKYCFFGRFILSFWRVSKQILEMFFTLLKSFIIIKFNINHICRQWSGYKYCYLTLIIWLNTVKWFQVLLCSINISV